MTHPVGTVCYGCEECFDNSIEYQLTTLRICIARIAQSAGFENLFLKDEKLLNEAISDFSNNSQWVSLCLLIRLEFDKIQAEKEEMKE